MRASRPTLPGVVGAVLLNGGLLVWWLLNSRPGGIWPLIWGLLLLLVGVQLPGISNQVSIARAYLAVPGMVYALNLQSTWALLVVVFLAGISDLLDGWLARSRSEISDVGGALDPVADGVFFVSVAGGLAISGNYPLWLAGVVGLRYLLPALVGGILVLMRRSLRLQHTPLGQVATLLIALGVGGLILARSLDWPTGGLLTVIEVVLPIVTVAAWINLFWINREAFLQSSRIN